MLLSGVKETTGVDEMASEIALVKVLPPKYGDFNLQSFMNVLEAMDVVGESISLEIATVQGQVEMYLRSARADHVITTLMSHYPYMTFEAVALEDDPLYVDYEEENCWRQVLWPAGDEWLPFQVYDEKGLLQYSSDPFIDMIGGMSSEIQPEARVVSRLVLSQKDHDWSETWRNRAIRGTGGENQNQVDEMRKNERSAVGGDFELSMQMQPLYMLAAAVGFALFAYFVYDWLWPLWQQGLKGTVMFYGSIMGVGLVVLICFALWVLWKIGYFSKKPETKFYDPDLVKLRVEGAAFRMEVHVYAILNEDKSEGEAIERLLRPTIAAYRSFDNPLGCRFEASKIVMLDGFDPRVDDLGFLGGEEQEKTVIKSMGRIGEGVVGTREAAGFWHVPGETATVPGLLRAGSRRVGTPQELFVLPDSGHDGSVLIGSEPYRDGGERDVYMPAEILDRHQLYVAKTGSGKSTLMVHVAVGILMNKASGLTDATLVVVDPHSDLVVDIVNRVPADVAHDVRLIDMGDKERACGINLLDARAFPERDLTIPTIISIAKTSSVNWGDRMEAIMQWTFTALYEANRNREEHEQYTIFDGVEFLTDLNMRKAVIEEGRSVDVAKWWESIFPSMVPDNDNSALAPVLRKIGEYAASESAVRVLGQPRCTLDLEEIIYSGKILLVNTARAETGPEVSAIIGAAILNLTEYIIRKQSKLPPEERQKVNVVVDEIQTFPGVDFDSKLAELNKYNGRLVMATQNLDRLNEMTESGKMRETILSNIGCLIASQVNASDAKILSEEFSHDMLDERDIMGLPRHHCYGRMNLDSGTELFSMEVMRPFPANEGMNKIIREASSAYTTPVEVLDARRAASVAEMLEQLFNKEDDGLEFDQQKLED